MTATATPENASDSPEPARNRAPLREATVRVIPRAVPAPAGEGAEARADEPTEEQIEIAISSEAPVERGEWTGWDRWEPYTEILGHAPEEIDLSYARDGLPLLIGHDDREWTHDQIGIVENITIGADRVLRGRARFSKAPRAQEVKQDMLDGIRKKISVGYDPGEQFTPSEENGKKVRRYTRWRPLEVSSVPIPADYDVGVGRSGAPRAVRQPEIRVGAQRGKDNMATETKDTAPATAPSFDAERKKEAERVKEISALAVLHGKSEKLSDWIGGGASVEQVQRFILEDVKKKQDELLTKAGGDSVLKLTKKEEEQYSIVRAIMGAAEGKLDGFEREVSDELSKRLKRSPSTKESFFAPTNIDRPIRGLSRRPNVPGQRVSPLAAGTSASGQQLVFTEYAGFIPLLRNRMLATQLGARLLSGLQGNPGFVTQPSGATFQWIGETTSPSATSFGTGLRTMTPHNGAALTAFSRQLLAQSSEDVESLVWDDLGLSVALGIDLAVFQGSGSANQPTGILNTTGIGSVTLGTAGGAIVYGTCVGLETEITVDNADLATMAYVTTPRVAGVLKTTQQFSGTNGVPIWTGTVHDGLVNGYKAAITNQVPSNGTKGSVTGSLHSIVFGVFSEVLIGEWGAMEMIVDPYKSKPTLIEVATHVMVDVFLRHIESFAATTDIVVP